jgi:threonine synthase
MQRQCGHDARPLSVLVATSGDTGGAVAAAFHRRSGMRVDVFYPHGQVSGRQEHQLTCWSDNVRAFRVDGTFDECQDLVKAAFQDEELNTRARLTSANSINLGRLLPQMVYYALSAIEIWRASGDAPSFIVPTGNLGNALACIWARSAGLPIGEIVLATNRNRAIADFFATGMWEPRASVASLASAMDVGNPSNMERLRDLYAHADLTQAFRARAVDDDEIRAQIKKDYDRFGQIWCPHTATAFRVYDELEPGRRAAAHWVCVATAHPAKFEEIVEPLIGREIPLPAALAEILALPTEKIDILADLNVLRGYY